MLDFITWHVDPVLLHLGPFTVRWYGIMFVIGFILGFNMARPGCSATKELPEKWLGTLLVYCIVATIIGARLGHVFFYAWDYYLPERPIEILYTWNRRSCKTMEAL